MTEISIMSALPLLAPYAYECDIYGTIQFHNLWVMGRAKSLTFFSSELLTQWVRRSQFVRFWKVSQLTLPSVGPALSQNI